MTTIRIKTTFLCALICLFGQTNHGASAIHSGYRSWCPYQMGKVIPCKVRNGTEQFYGRNICWKSLNGSYSCTKKLLHRPKFVTTYKTVLETRYKCCPGWEGSNCENECLNCNTQKQLLSRVGKLETAVKAFAELDTRIEEGDLLNQIFVEDILHGNVLNAQSEYLREKPLTTNVLEARINTLYSDFSNLEGRLHKLESQVSYLLGTLTEIQNQRHSPFQVAVDSIPRSTSISASSTSRVGGSLNTATVNLTKNLINDEYSKDERSKQEALYIMQLEDNLERGDIASTLNDDYGEELLFENSTEQYLDPLQRGA